MFVIKRDGRKESVKFDKVTARIQKLAYGLSEHVETFSVAQKVIEGITPDIETRVLDTLAMETAASLTVKHPDYATLAARIAITSLHKETKKSFNTNQTLTKKTNQLSLKPVRLGRSSRKAKK